MRITRVLTCFIACALIISGTPTVSVKSADDVFYDDFTGGFDTDKWLVAYKNWGGKVTENGVTSDYNGGVLPENVTVRNGKLILEGHGNRYTGDIRGVNRDMTRRSDGKRTGAAIATREYFASGSYEVCAKVAPELGACSAIWTFEYEEDWDSGAITNHEIDIEMPGRPGSAAKDQSYSYALCNTWIGENEGEYRTGYTDIGTDQADGKYHKYRFDWHTGDADQEPRVEFYFDDELKYTSTEYIPTNAGRLWTGLWFPRKWAGEPDFDTSTFEIDYVRITPFHESGDKPQNETYPDDGWGDPSLVHVDEPLMGDVNGDNQFSAADLVALSKWLLHDGTDLASWSAGNFCRDDRLDVYDLALMRRELTSASAHKVRVTNTEELRSALAAAQPGDIILCAPGECIYSGPTPKGRMFTGEAEGLPNAPITLRSEDPDDPAVISGTTMNSYYALTITGDWWNIADLKITNASKGIIIDNSEHTSITGCEVYNIGAEGIHFRDNSSYCLAEDCYIHDTGLVSPGYGEGVYVGSAKSTTGYGFDCHYNTIRSCRIGPNVAAEHIDVKEYTIGTLIENCTFDGTGMSGENSSKSFVNIKGNEGTLRGCVGYRNGCEKITRAFEANNVVDGWGQDSRVYGNKAYMDTAVNANGGKMYFLNAWDCSSTVWENFIAYEDGELISVDDEADHWKYYNCNMLTYGEK